MKEIEEDTKNGKTSHVHGLEELTFFLRVCGSRG
jgi:hypothetical protein